MGVRLFANEEDYLIFVLGYDLLQKEFGGLECDLAFEQCKRIIKLFMKSDDYLHSKVGSYDALSKWLDENIKVNRYCKNCHSQLIKSDLPQYPYLCLHCDENMYDIETYSKEEII